MKKIIPIVFALILLTGTSGVSYESVFAQTPIDPPRQEAASPSDNNGNNDRVITGQLQIIWSHPNPNISSDFNPVKKYFLAGEESYELVGFEGAAIAHGGPLKMNGKDIAVRGVHDPQTGVLIVKGIENAGNGSSGDDSQVYAASTTGSQKWATLPCKFADNPSEPRDLDYFVDLLAYTDTFWREASYDTINLNGSVELDWKTLPQPGSYYVAGNIKHTLIAQDCAAVHDADVHFPDFDGINFILNEALDCCAWGGGVYLNIDGQGKVYDATWMPPWAFNNMDVLAHEMGHGFGLPHSSGPYNQTYDSQWDIMSRGGTCIPQHPDFGCIGVHTVSWHKDVLGWIDASDVYVDDTTQNQVVFIERLAEPINVSDPNVYQLVKIPTSSSTDFYTLEVRKYAGFDNIGKIPGEAVVIHKVDTTLGDRNAQVVVNPYESSGTNGPGSQWTTGETYQFPDTNTSVLIGAMANDGFTITLNPNGANTPPTADAGGETIVIDEDDDGYEEVTLDGSASTDDGTITSWDWTEGVTPLGSGETLNHVFAVGTHTLTLTVTDNDGATDVDTVTVTILEYVPPNTSPVADAQSVSTDEDTSLPITLSATDDDGDSLTFSVVTNPSSGSLSGTSPNLTYTPNSDFNGNDSFTFKANDGTDDSNLATVSITVNSINDAPITDSQSVSTDEDVSLPITLTASDVDGDPLTFTVLSNPTNGVLSGTAPNLTYTPNSGFDGGDSLTFKANDGADDSNIATVSITVNPINEIHLENITGESNTKKNWKATVTLTVFDSNESPFLGAIVTGTWQGGPTENCTTDSQGQCQVSDTSRAPSQTFTVDDISGGGINYNSNENYVSSSITINQDGTIPGNTTPVADNQSVLTIVNTPIGITLTASDADGDSLTYSIVSGPSNGSLSGTEPSLTYTPTLDFEGPDSFTFRANDGEDDSNIATISINVSPINDPPVAGNDFTSTDEDSAINVVVLTNDSDPDNDSFSISTFDGTSTQGASISDNGDGTLNYDPTTSSSLQSLNNGESLNDTFTYTIQDEHGAIDSATVTVSVSGSDDAPSTLSITSINPDTVTRGSTNVVIQVAGTGFSGSSTVAFENGGGPIPTITNTSYQNPGLIQITIDVSSNGPKNTTWDLRVNDGGDSVILNDALNIQK